MTKKKYGLKLSTVRKLEDELCDYPNYHKQLEDLRSEIMTPWIPTDTNIGGGFVPSNTSKTEMAVTNYLCSIRRGKILEFKSAIERIINTSSRKEREFIQEYYFNKKTLIAVCYDIHISESTAHRIKKKIVSKLAEELGEC
ncbi:phage transcriptional regulator, RinA family protein [Staphylococcus aureus 1801-2 2011]|uniref:RinA family phage transcriptional activator n=1 Tax=Staphylococcus aureus TaxID=1280 RepID=UPI0004D8007E|nr:RinA family phage transcriptional activator [Staphylococcus aureus]KEK48494.1 phage transcriptional regulator, RinA family protein [Staphylococcus aureus 1801-2 2010]KEK49499.1 phage transcriptional regulator, RinA family protein [Staphylococcus aureus 1801-2 2010]KEK69311.1 phage transcriptional regulator, RinA family protein [Staphylococcus aureus 1801-2 2011]